MNRTEIKYYLKSNWGKKSILDIQKELDVDLYSLLQISVDLSLYSYETTSIGRRWTEEEDSFLKDYSNILSIQEACNLLHRSRYATYQRIKLLNLNNMVDKRRTNTKR